MNEKIKEIAKTAGLNFDGYGDPIWGALDDDTQFLNIFSSMIIEECIKTIVETSKIQTENGLSEMSPPHQFCFEIREKFGVKSC